MGCLHLTFNIIMMPVRLIRFFYKYYLRKTILLLALECFSITLFSQNTLGSYLQAAIQNSPVSIDNQNQVHSLALDSMLIRAGLKPQVSFTSNDYYAPVINGYGYDEIITNIANVNALLGVQYKIVGNNQLQNQYSGLNIQKQLLELNTKLSQRDLKQTVSAQYITVYGEQQLLSNTESVIQVLGNEDAILKSMAEKGVYRQTDYLSFLVSLKQQQLAYARQQMEMKSDLYLLNYICGITDTSLVTLPDPEVFLLSNRPAEQTYPFRLFVLDSMALQNSMDRIRYDYVPKLSLYGDAGYNSSFLYHAERNFGASFGLNLVVPIYDGHQRDLQMEKLKYMEDTRLHQADYFKRQFNTKQLQLLQQISATENLTKEAGDQLKLSSTLLTANRQLLQTGEAKMADYILSLTNYVSSQATVQQLHTNRMQLINQFNYLNY